MAQFDQVVGGLGAAVTVARHDLRRVDRRLALVARPRRDADHRHVELFHQCQQAAILGDRRQQDDPAQALDLDEFADVVEEVGAVAVARVHHQFHAGAAQRIQRPGLHVDDVLGVGVVVDQPVEEGAAEGQAAGLRVRAEADAGDDVVDLVAGFLAHAGRMVDDARHGLLRYAGQGGDVVDGRLLAALEEVLDGIPADAVPAQTVATGKMIFPDGGRRRLWQGRLEERRLGHMVCSAIPGA